MTDKAPKKQRQSSPRFPFITLEKAVARASELRKAGGGGPVLVKAARETWGYGLKSSGGHQTMAALKAYGLTTESGEGERRQISLTSDAQRYFRDEREEARAELRKAFVLAPKAMAQAWADWNGPPPEDHVARSHLKVTREFADNAAQEFLEIYRANIAYAKLSSSDRVTITGEDDDDSEGSPLIEIGDFVQAEVNGTLAFPKPARVRAFGDHIGQKWLFVEGHKAGVLVEQAELTQKGKGPPPSGAAFAPPLLDEAPPPSALAEGERVVFTEEGARRDQYLKLVARGEVDDTLLEALEDFVKRQRKRLAAPKPSAN